jgi:hypothetical protein
MALERVGVKAVIDGLALYLAGIKKMDSATDRLGKGLARGLSTATKAATIGIVAMGAASVGFAIKGLKMADTIEQASLAYETLLGSATAAEKRIKELTDFAAKTPFELAGIIEADRLLETFGARSIENLTMVGDAAAGVGVGIEEIAFWFGRAATAIESGRPFGEAAMRLQELGLLSGEARNKLEGMAEAGANSTEIMGVLTGELGRFNGLMEKQSKTLGGMMSTLNDNFNLLLAQVVRPFLPAVKGALSGLTDLIEQHQKDIEGFAQGAAEWFRTHKEDIIATVTTMAVGLATTGKAVKDVGTWIMDHQVALVAAIAAIGLAFTWTNPLSAALIGAGGVVFAIGLFRQSVDELPMPLLKVRREIDRIVMTIVEFADTTVQVADMISTAGFDAIPGWKAAGDEIQDNLWGIRERTREDLAAVQSEIDRLTFDHAVDQLQAIEQAMEEASAATRNFHSALGSLIGAGVPWSAIMSYQGGGIVPGPAGMPQLAIVHGGEQVVSAGNLAGFAPAPTFNFPMTLNLQNATDWNMVARVAHRELDVTLDRARTDAFKGGYGLGSGIG